MIIKKFQNSGAITQLPELKVRARHFDQYGTHNSNYGANTMQYNLATQEDKDTLAKQLGMNPYQMFHYKGKRPQWEYVNVNNKKGQYLDTAGKVVDDLNEDPDSSTGYNAPSIYKDNDVIQGYFKSSNNYQITPDYKYFDLVTNPSYADIEGCASGVQLLSSARYGDANTAKMGITHPKTAEEPWGGSAWLMRQNMLNKGAQPIFDIADTAEQLGAFDTKKSPKSRQEAYMEAYNQNQHLYDPNALQEGDVVGLYGSSSHMDEAMKEADTANSRSLNTHVGVVAKDPYDGKLKIFQTSVGRSNAWTQNLDDTEDWKPVWVMRGNPDVQAQAMQEKLDARKTLLPRHGSVVERMTDEANTAVPSFTQKRHFWQKNGDADTKEYSKLLNASNKDFSKIFPNIDQNELNHYMLTLGEGESKMGHSPMQKLKKTFSGNKELNYLLADEFAEDNEKDRHTKSPSSYGIFNAQLQNLNAKERSYLFGIDRTDDTNKDIYNAVNAIDYKTHGNEGSSKNKQVYDQTSYQSIVAGKYRFAKDWSQLKNMRDENNWNLTDKDLANYLLATWNGNTVSRKNQSEEVIRKTLEKKKSLLNKRQQQYDNIKPIQ